MLASLSRRTGSTGHSSRCFSKQRTIRQVLLPLHVEGAYTEKIPPGKFGVLVGSTLGNACVLSRHVTLALVLMPSVQHAQNRCSHPNTKIEPAKEKKNPESMGIGKLRSELTQPNSRHGIQSNECHNHESEIYKARLAKENSNLSNARM
jgi:hypothetical protein